MSSAAIPRTKKKRKWFHLAICAGPHALPDDYGPVPNLNIKPDPKPKFSPPSSPSLVDTKCSPLSPTVSLPPPPPRRRLVRFQHPLPVPRKLVPLPSVLARIAYFSDSHALRKLRRVSRAMQVVAESILLRRIAVMNGGARVLPPPGGTGHLSIPALHKPKPEAGTTLWDRPESPVYDSDSDPDSDPESDADDHPPHNSANPSPPGTPRRAKPKASMSGETFAALVNEACAAITATPCTPCTYRLPLRSRLLLKARVVDIHPEADAAVLRRYTLRPPPIIRAHPGASGTLTSATVVVFLRALDTMPPAYPRPALTTSAARTVITNLLDARGTESVEGLSCGIDRTVILISPYVPGANGRDGEESDDELAEVATLVPGAPDPSLSIGRIPTLDRRVSVIEEEADPHRLLESLAAHIARLLPASGSQWTIVGAESWPWDWVESVSEHKFSDRDESEMEGAMRAMVSARFASWADKASGERLRFVSRERWRREAGREVYELATEL